MNSTPDLKFVVGAVLEVDNDSLEVNRPAPDPKLKGPETLAAVHDDSIVIVPAIHMRLSELFPSVVVSSTPVVAATPLGV